MATSDKKGNNNKITALYCRLSVDDTDKQSDEESNSIKNQKQILQDYCKKNGYHNTRFFVDDGVSGTTFDRPGFKEMEALAEDGKIGTIIVKDLSRFGREQTEMGRLTQIVYPSLGITFISIQEHVNTSTGEGVEIMPFHTIFNEWYAAQTSKKIRQVWKTKSEHNMRVSHRIPFGYVRDKDDKEKWLIDEEAAKVVRHIFELYLSGMGIERIARRLQEEKVLTPNSYYASIGRGYSVYLPDNPYEWKDTSVANILDNRKYTGCMVNNVYSTVSYKVHKRTITPEEDRQIIPDLHEAIISEEDWLRVHELRQNKRRTLKSGKTSMFSGLLYCHECGSKLHFCTSKTFGPRQDFYRCAKYKSGRGTCSIHFIRNIVLERIVLAAISDLADFVRCYESVFMYMINERNKLLKAEAQKAEKRKLAQAEKRHDELDFLSKRVYEDNAFGKLPDDRYEKLMQSYEAEQKEIDKTIEDLKANLAKTTRESEELRYLFDKLRDLSQVTELDPALVNTLIKRIEIHDSEKRDGKTYVKVDIYFTAIGMFDIPSEKEINAVMKRMESERETA
ncbi:MAG: recombinase family protein [Firmicutes bacterium]|nr:recombinase family protein [Bacillota bacterium]